MRSLQPSKDISPTCTTRCGDSLGILKFGRRHIACASDIATMEVVLHVISVVHLLTAVR